MTLRNQLVVLTTATCLPILAFAAILIFLLNRHFVDVEQQRLTSIVHDLAADIDREITAILRALEALATSSYLDSGDLRGFHRQAAQAVAAIQPWEAIVLVDSSGQQIVNTRRSFGSPLPVTGTPELNAAVFKTGRLAVSNLFSGAVVHTPVIAVGVPVIRDGQLKFTLQASTAPNFLTNLLKQRNLSASWYATVIDRNQVILARVPSIDKYLGQPANPRLAAKSQGEPRGSFTGTTKEGIAVSTAYQRSELTGWTVAVGIPTALLHGPMRRFIVWLSIGGGLLFIFGLVLAFFFGRRITTAIAGLADGAEAFGRGEIPPPLRTPIADVNRVAHVMDRAAFHRQQFEEALHKSEANLAAAQTQAKLGSWEHNLDTQTGWWSAEMYRLFDREPALGAPALAEFLELIHPEDRAAVEEGRDRALETGGNFSIEMRSNPERGPVRHFCVLVNVIRGADGRVERLAGTVQDITDRKRAEDALKRSHEELEEKVAERTRELLDANVKLHDLDRLKSQFLANMSHELRTPLNAIIGFSELMHDGKAGGLISAEQKEYLTDILDSGRHLLHLIDDILDLSKVEAGRMEVLNSTFHIDEIIIEVVHNIAPAMSAKELKLIRDIPPDLPQITTDRRKLLQILLNLASNAVKFTTHGEIGIRCEKVSDTLRVSVWDTGIGIKAGDMAALFQPFSQIDDSLRKRHIGTGLGLYLSMSLAHLLGGTITVESEYGRGSTFRLCLPISPPVSNCIAVDRL